MIQGRDQSTNRHSGSQRRTRVAVLVDLQLRPDSGGHVKCWQRIASAAANCSDSLELTLYVQGRRSGFHALSDNVRIRHLPACFSSATLKFVSNVADHSDLAPIHPRLLRELSQYDVIHTTDAWFAYARTAELASLLWGKPLTTSLHTDTPAYTGLYCRQTLARLFREESYLYRLLNNTLQIPERLRSHSLHRLQRHLNRCQAVLMPEQGADYWRQILKVSDDQHYSLRRGIDTRLFHPRHADRAALERDWGIPQDVFLISYAGRIDPGKSVMTLARAVRLLLDQGIPVHLIMAGVGPERARIEDLLGDVVTLTGQVPQTDLARFYASSDCFAFSSQVEVAPNVVFEAKASGLPVIVSPAAEGFIRNNGIDGQVIASNHPADWAMCINALRKDSGKRRQMAKAAFEDVRLRGVSWETVLEQDLLSVWESVLVDRNESLSSGVRS